MTTSHKLLLIVLLLASAPVCATENSPKISRHDYTRNAVYNSGLAIGFGYLAVSASVPPVLIATSAVGATYYGYRSILYAHGALTGKPIDDKVQAHTAYTWNSLKQTIKNSDGTGVRTLSADTFNQF